MTERFDDWLGVVLTSDMAELSRKHRDEFVEPVRRVSRQLSQSLQDFRNRLSERMLVTLGVPLRTTEMELQTRSPRSPDVRVGKIFDRNWELLSWLIPMALVQGVVLRHYHHKVGGACVRRTSHDWHPSGRTSSTPGCWRSKRNPLAGSTG